MAGQKIQTTDVADAQYLGNSGVTSDCVRSLVRLVYGGEPLKGAVLITCGRHHGFVLYGQFDDLFVIKDGFTSGYLGEGPRGLAVAIGLLERHRVPVEEHEIDANALHRLQHSCLLKRDIQHLADERPVRPRRIYEYLSGYESFLSQSDWGVLISEYYPSTIPFRIIDDRIYDLAIAFHDDHDRAIFAAFRRLEDAVRARTGLADSGSRLFSNAFLVPESPLTWAVPDEGERKGRANMFSAVFGAFRNARMHREIKQSDDEALREFLLVNELFVLERAAIENVSEGEAGA